MYPIIARIMLGAFGMGSTKATAKAGEWIYNMMDDVDAALESHGWPHESAMISGSTGQPNYVDISFASLTAPLLTTNDLFARRNLYARGRFNSFTKAGAWLPDGMPGHLNKLERDLVSRPCGQFVLRLYEKHR